MNKRFQIIIIFLFFLKSQNSFSQKFNFEKAFIRDSENITIQISAKEIQLDSIDRIELKSKAILTLKSGKKIKSDDFFTDLYYDSDTNLYNITFKSNPKNLSSLKSISGTFKYFTPSISKKSILNLKINQNLNEKLIFSEPNSKILYLNALKIDSIKNNKTKFKHWKNKIINDNNLDKNIFKDAILKYLRNRKQFKTSNNLQDNVLFYFENSKFKFVRNKFLKSYHYNSPEVSSEFHSDFWTLWELRFFNNSIPKEYYIEVFLENTESIKELNFSLDLTKY